MFLFYTVARLEGPNIDICTDLDFFCNDTGDVGGRMLRLLRKWLCAVTSDTYSGI
jgi:hypothetical protein